MQSILKPKACAQCGKEFMPARLMQAVCSAVCASRKVRKEKLAERQEVKERLKALETYPQLLKKAQVAFNGFVRARDMGKGCISCGTQLTDEPNSYDCGHYRSVGSAPHMRFVEDNANGQCKHCNRYLAGNHVEYRKGLIERIGLRAVELVEADKAVRKYTREGLIELARHYRAETKKLQGGRE